MQVGNLPQKLTLPLMQTQWAQAINPLLGRATNQMNVLDPYTLIVGTNVINHKLGRVMQGWFQVDLQAPVGGTLTIAPLIYRNAALNNLTLSLYSNVAAIITFGVF